MSELIVPEIVTILIKDPVLIEQRKRFADFLHIPSDVLCQLNIQFNSGNINLYDFFTTIIEKWISQTSPKPSITTLIAILRQNEFNSSADSLLSIRTISSKSSFGVRNPIRNFVGRKKELDSIFKWFNENRIAVLISAIGGQGKTELCRSFLQQILQEVSSSSIIATWFSGANNQVFTQNISEYSKSLLPNKQEEKPLPLSIHIENIRRQFGPDYKWIVVIDNVDESFKEFIPAVQDFIQYDAFILVTSRRTDILIESEHIDLQPLEDKDSWKFIQNSLIQTEIIDAVELCKALENYPLALQQAVAFIKYKQRVTDCSYGIRDYLKILNSKILDVLDHKLQLCGYDKTICKIVMATLEQIKKIDENNESKASSLLFVLTLINPGGIKCKFLKILFLALESEKYFKKSLEILKTFSLVNVDKKIVSIHRIVQQISLEYFKLDTFYKWEETTEKILNAIDLKNIYQRSFWQHLQQIWNIASSLPQIVRKHSNFVIQLSKMDDTKALKRKSKKKPEASFMFNEQTRHCTVDFLKTNLAKFNEILGAEHIDTLRMEYELAIYKDVLFLGKDIINVFLVWKKVKKVLGEGHKETLHALKKICSRLDYVSKRESHMCRQFLLKLQIEHLGENHKKTIDSKMSIAGLLEELFDWQEAILIYRQILEFREKDLGPLNKKTLHMRKNIARMFYKDKMFNEAKLEYEELLELQVKAICDDSETIYTKYRLALTLLGLGQKTDAMDMMNALVDGNDSLDDYKLRLKNRFVSKMHPRVLSPDEENNIKKMSELAMQTFL